jgi:tripartite-type tricarboxylate transporter receptor subunit TctC
VFFFRLPFSAQPYPAKAIKIVVPFAVGGIADTFARVIAQKVQEAWGQPVVVENRAGAGGNIGADLVAKSPPDGYTLVMGSIGTHAVNPHLVQNMPYDAQKDFVPVAHVLEAEGLLVVNPALPVKTVPELIAHLKANPGKLSYASAGVGTASHLAGELFKTMSGVDMAHVPYKGNAPAITDVMGGQTHMIFATMPTVIQQARAGRLRSVAVIGSQRAKALPDIPTIAETLPGVRGRQLGRALRARRDAGGDRPALERGSAKSHDFGGCPAAAGGGRGEVHTDHARILRGVPAGRVGALGKNDPRGGNQGRIAELVAPRCDVPHRPAQITFGRCRFSSR